ncbi:MAG: hypothetical protein P1S60_04350 [Anaerolineae bacterium]|nr:hypothetical protein [Anaerolineae bacterium]
MAENTEDILYCHWHPQTETTLRCYQCNTPICAKCARRTPVGYICRDCQQGRKKRFDQSTTRDYFVAGIVSLILGGLASVIPLIGSWWFILFLSPLSGTLIAEIVWRLVGRRYGQHLWWIVAGGITVGTLPLLGIELLSFLGTMTYGNIWGAVNVIVALAHIGLAGGTAIARLRLR